MPTWKDYKAEAISRGSLAHELYVIRSTPAGDPSAVRASLSDHLAYQAQMEAEGTLFLAGPMSDETGDQMQGMGLIIYRAASLADARAIAEADPMHKSGARTFELRRWMINEGALSLKIGLSSKRVALD